jgi:hypothetical protein
MRSEAFSSNGRTYLAVVEGQVTSEDDALELVSACASHDTNLLLLPQEAISKEFTWLSTRVAGLVLGKLANYKVRTAAMFDFAQAEGAFVDFLVEARTGSDFRAFADQSEAVAWLTEG